MDDLLECKICFRIYNDVRKPIILLCGHTFCSLCVLALSPEEGFCPTCRKNILISFQKLPVNYALLELALSFEESNSSASAIKEVKQTFSADSYCKNHKEQLIKYWCKTSEEWLCEDCVENHKHKESNALSNCLENVDVALRSLKEKFQKSNTDKLNEIQRFIEKTECISKFSNVLGYKLKKLSLAKNSLRDKNYILSEQLKELKTKGLKFQFKLTESNLKLEEVYNVSGWIETEKNLKKMEKMTEINSYFLKLQQQKNVVSLF